MEAFVFPEHSEWTQEFAKMAKLDRLGKFQMINLIDGIRTVQDAFVHLKLRPSTLATDDPLRMV